MGRGIFVLALLVLFSTFTPSLQDNVTLTVEGATTMATTDDNFICTTLDWWPKERCDNNMCTWTNASLLNLDLRNPVLQNAVKAFKSMRIRLGGSLQDQIVYRVPVDKFTGKCQSLQRIKGAMFGYSEGCLLMRRWRRLNRFFDQTGALVTFGLNALIGRNKGSGGTLYTGKWDPTNARDFIEYTYAKGIKIDSWELGNELCGSGVAARVDSKQYGEDLIELKRIIDDVYPHTGINRPKLLAPGGFFDKGWFSKMLKTSGPGVLDVVTHHIYNLGPGSDPALIKKIQDPHLLSKVSKTYKNVENTIKSSGPWTSAWVGESGGAYNGGGRVSRTYVDSFWYLDQLGMTSTFNHKVFCRQALVGGNYALLNTNTFIPNPDYYSALLWHRLMGPGVLRTAHNSSPYLRSYAHCSKDKPGVTVLLINMSNSTSFDVSFVNMNLSPSHVPVKEQSEVYHLTPKDGDIESNVMLLNGQPLSLTSDGDIPELSPLTVDASTPLHIEPQAIVFVKFKDFNALACSN